MKNLLKCFSILLIVAGLNDSLTAQPQYYNYNNGGGSNSFPLNVTTGKDVQLLYLAGAFNQPSAAPAGNITTLWLRFSGAITNVTYTTLTIKMGQSAITNLTSGSFYAGPMTTVYSRASVVWNYAIGWGAVTLDAPFAYDPTQSLIVDIGQCSASAGGGSMYFTTQTNTLRVWSVGGCPFVCYASSSVYNYDMGIDVGGAASPPTVATTAATGVTSTTASLNGTVNANGASTAVTFQYGLTTAYGTTVPGVPSPVTGSSVTPVTAAIAGLAPCTLYHYRVVGVNSGGTSNGNDLTLTTTCAAPTVVTQAASAITGTTATLNGTVNANNSATTTSFDYGLTTLYGTNIAGNPLSVGGSSATGVTGAITGLLPNTLYHFRINGANAFGTSNGSDLTFTTAQIPPTVTTGVATGVNSTAATMTGTVNANNLSTNVFFDYGLTTLYGTTVNGAPTPVGGTVTTNVSASLTLLTPNTTYHYRVRGVNAAGTSNGNDMTFFTACNVAGAAGPITGPGQVCNGGTGYIYSVAPIANASGYNWTLPFGGIITLGGNTNVITVSYPNQSYSGNVFVYGIGCAGNGSSSNMVVNVNTNPTPTIIGPTSLCMGSGGNVYTTQAGMTNYVWTVIGGVITGGGTTSSNTATVTWNTAGTQSVCVNYNNAAGCPGLTPGCFSVNVNPLPVPTIAGNANPCTALPVVYTTQGGMTGYSWTVSAGGFINSGNGTSSINVTWNTAGAQNVSVIYTNGNGCTNTTPGSYAVTVKQGPAPTITGQTLVCVNSGYYMYTTQTGMTGYSWSISPGGSIVYGGTTSTVTVNWTVAGSQSISVNYTNGNGCAAPVPGTLAVSVTAMPGPAGSISGPAAVCAGSNNNIYSVALIPNALIYIWTLPPGASIPGGENGNTVSVSFASNAVSGNITVNGNNLCGNGAVSPPFPVTVTDLPDAAPAIIGPTTLCQGSTGIEFSVTAIPGATGYNWTLPAGASIFSGFNTNDIIVDFSMSAVSGAITVAGTNNCGTGTASPALNLTVLVAPQTPVITNVGMTLTSDAPAGNQWYVDGNIIPLAVDQSYVATLPGTYWDVVTLNGCSSAPSNQIILPVGINTLQSPGISIYPVPNDGLFKLSITSSSKEAYTVNVLNDLGITVFEQKNIVVSGTTETKIDLRPVPSGTYTLIVRNNENQVVRKIIITK